MPLIKSADLELIAIADIGGLGAKEGTPVPYHWTPPSFWRFVPAWIGVLVLLGLPANRSRQARWVLVPLTFLTACVYALPYAANPQGFGELLPVFRAAAFGVTALWLSSFIWVWKHRFLTLVGSFLVTAGFGLVSFAAEVASVGGGMQTVGLGVGLVVFSALISLGLLMTGWLCRGQYGPWRVLVCVAVSCVTLSSVLVVPFALMARISGAAVPLLGVLQAILSLAVMCFSALLPFIVLSFANSLYRERLKGMLHLSQEKPPTVLTSGPAHAQPDSAVPA